MRFPGLVVPVNLAIGIDNRKANLLGSRLLSGEGYVVLPVDTESVDLDIPASAADEEFYDWRAPTNGSH